MGWGALSSVAVASVLADSWWGLEGGLVSRLEDLVRTSGAVLWASESCGLDWQHASTFLASIVLQRLLCCGVVELELVGCRSCC